MDVHFAHGIGFHRVTLHERFNEGVHALRKGGKKQTTKQDGSSHLVVSVFWQGLRKQPRADLALAVYSNALIVPRTTCGCSRHGLCAGIFATGFWAMRPYYLGPQGICKEQVHE